MANPPVEMRTVVVVGAYPLVTYPPTRFLRCLTAAVWHICGTSSRVQSRGPEAL